MIEGKLGMADHAWRSVRRESVVRRRWSVRRWSAWFGVLLLLVGSAAEPGWAQGRPNVLLIMTDDQGWGDLYSHGNSKIDTPVLDRLATEGARFDRFYVSPVCAPTRASLLTGRYHLRTGTAGVTRGMETMRAGEVTLAEVLGAGGYATGIFGKWHNGAHYPNDPLGQGFDTFVGFSAGHWNNYFGTHLVRDGRTVETEGYITDVLTDAALAFIEEHRDEPFFAYVPYNTPHSPFQVPDRYFDRYQERGLDDETAAAYAMVENIDDNVGRLLAALDRLGLAENTIVLFLTDNGPNGDRFNGGMRGRKGSVHEGGVRVPLFLRWPGRVPEGRLVRQITAHIDLLPTLAELTGVPLPEGGAPLDGISLVPLLQREEPERWPERLLFSHWAGTRGGTLERYPGAVRTERYRAVNTGGPWQLYDMIQDPYETIDLAAELPEVVARLGAAYEAWFQDVTQPGIERPAIPVGYEEAPVVELPAPEAYFEGGIGYYGGQGWANDWLTDWTSPEAAAWWELDVVRPGRYEIELLYTVPVEDVGARLRAEAGEASVEGRIRRAHDPAPVPSPDRIERKEVYEKRWAPLRLGMLRLEKGPQRLYVRAPEIPGTQALDLKAVRLRRLE